MLESSEDENKEGSEDESDHSGDAESASSHKELGDFSEHQGELQAGSAPDANSSLI